MLKNILLLLVIAMPFFSQSQYTQNIDSLKRKEIKRLILNQDNSHKAKTHLQKFQSRKLTGGTLMALGAAILISASKIEGPDNHEANIGAIYTGLLGTIVSATGLGIYISASDQYEKAIEHYTFKGPESLAEIQDKLKNYQPLELNDQNLSSEVRVPLLKYQESRKASNVSFIISASALAAGIILQEFEVGTKVPNMMYSASGAAASFGIITGVASMSQYDNAKKAYLKQLENETSANHDFQIRNGSQIYNSIYR
ncbi:hypothetical protein [Ekhidna sp.]